MSVKKFKFVSPGIFVDEIDNSGVPAIPDAIGPVVIGRAEKGPALLPTTVDSFSEFVDVFGLPVGGGLGGDVWRNGNFTSPMYGTYAAQAWLKNNSPLTYVRLLGDEHPDSGATRALGAAGWIAGAGTTSATIADNDGAYGLFIIPSASVATNATGTLAAVFYTDGAVVRLSGSAYAPLSLGASIKGTINKIERNGAGLPVYNSGADFEFTLEISDTDIATNTGVDKHVINFNKDSSKYIRKVLNTSPVLTNSNIVASANQKKYWLGETFDKFLTSGETNKSTGKTPVVRAATSENLIDFAGFSNNDDFTITVPASIGGTGTAITIRLTGADATGAASTTSTVVAVGVSSTPSAGTVAETVVDAINGFFGSGGAYNHAFASANSGVNTGVPGVSATLVSSTKIKLTADVGGADGNSIAIAAGTGDAATAGNATGGVGDSTTPASHAGFAGMSSAAARDCFGFIAALETHTSAKNWSDHLEGMAASSTGWIFSQHLAAHTNTFHPDPTKSFTVPLFKLHSHTGGEWNQNNIKISIQDIKISKNSTTDYGTFTVVIRQIRDNDGSPRVLEQFSNVNLNPNSLDYIARRIGDRYYTWNEDKNKYIEKGDYANRSAYVYVEVDTDVANNAVDARYVPFGFEGPQRPKPFTFVSGTAANAHGIKAFGHVARQDTDIFGNSCAANDTAIAQAMNPGAVTGFGIAGMIGPDKTTTNDGLKEGAFLTYMAADLTASVVFPTFALRSGSVDPSLSSGRFAYFGFDSRRSNSSTRFEESNVDIARKLAPDFDSTSNTETAFYFTLDDLISSEGAYMYKSGSYANTESVTAKANSYVNILDPASDASPSYAVKGFTVPLAGGFDGLDITESDPFNNASGFARYDADEMKNYAYYSVKKAINTVSDAEQVEVNLATVPGVTNEALTAHLINTCESRGDTLAIIDLKGGYTPIAEDGGTLVSAGTYGSVKETVDAMLDRGLNSSYGCAFYPWVQIRDAINDQIVWVPPSVVALGTFSSSERKSAPWFAPAGFTRGGLSEGSAGIPVLSVREKLTSEDRDSLYENNINPIASFPAEGIVIFGQKTLQLTQSALDRINVRRLLIFVKKEISRIAATTLFEPNVEQTWAGFTGRVIPFLEKVSSGGGLSAFKVVLDETTTTPDLVDRNIMYAKIFLKPAKAIEFIALDFVVTNSGAAFED